MTDRHTDGQTQRLNSIPPSSVDGGIITLYNIQVKYILKFFALNIPHNYQCLVLCVLMKALTFMIQTKQTIQMHQML